MNDDFSRTAALIAAEIGAGREQAAAAIRLLDEGSTVPFIARYRKEATGGLDDTQLRLLAERLVYVRELDARRGAILDSIRGQGKLTDELAAKIAGKSALVLKLLKRTLTNGADMPLSAALPYEQSMIGLVFDTGDAHEGCTAFLEKRAPAFAGR